MSKKKLYVIISIFLMIGITSSILDVRGHPPSNMSLNYNLASQELTVSISHSVANPSGHYIYRVRIWVNVSLVNTSLYSSQPSNNNFAYTYNITANIGATIQVTADCIQGGSITRSITVSETNGQTGGEPTISGYIGLISILYISTFIITFIIIKKRRLEQNTSEIK